MLPVLALPLLAHDFWIEPSSFRPQLGQAVALRLRVGQELLGDPVGRSTPLIHQFVLAGPEGKSPVPGREGGDPAGVARMMQPGLFIAGYWSNASPVELPADQFESYLKEEGLESIIAQRAKKGQSSAPGREVFYRCAKSLLLSGPANAAQADQALGFPLELIAEKNPYWLKSGEILPLRLLWQGKPLQGALVVSLNRRNPMHHQTARTGPDGRVRLKIAHDGLTMVKAVHMVPGGIEADWASYWASLTFHLDPPPAIAEVSRK